MTLSCYCLKQINDLILDNNSEKQGVNKPELRLAFIKLHNIKFTDHESISHSKSRKFLSVHRIG